MFYRRTTDRDYFSILLQFLRGRYIHDYAVYIECVFILFADNPAPYYIAKKTRASFLLDQPAKGLKRSKGSMPCESLMAPIKSTHTDSLLSLAESLFSRCLRLFTAKGSFIVTAAITTIMCIYNSRRNKI